MKNKKILLALVTTLAMTQTFAQYSIKKYSINNGGGKLAGGQYQLQGSIGQVDASDTLSQGDYSLNGGFWQQNTDLIYKNGFE
jgi:hypothetical protein